MSKPQDGLVSRFLNRPISHFITSHLLLKLPIHPNTWTMSIFVLPVIAAVLLARGDHLSIAIGAGLFQLYSILDGCDGEIARAKDLESQSGERLDYFCDFLGSLLYVIGLGFGLSHVHPDSDPAFLLEGIVCAGLIAVNELLLSIAKDKSVPASALDGTLYQRHRGMIEHSGIKLLGDKPAWWLMQLTKRDVATLAFLLLALLNHASWILHLWTIVAFASVIASGIAAIKSNVKTTSR